MYDFGVIIAYDCEKSKIRNKIVKICKNYGLKRLEYSVFVGVINKTAYNNMIAEFNDIELKTPFIVFVQRLSVNELNDFNLIEYDSDKLKHYSREEGKTVI